MKEYRLQWFFCNILAVQLEDLFSINIRAFKVALYLRNEFDNLSVLCVFEISNSLSYCSKNLEKNIKVGFFCANVLKQISQKLVFIHHYILNKPVWTFYKAQVQEKVFVGTRCRCIVQKLLMSEIITLLACGLNDSFFHSPELCLFFRKTEMEVLACWCKWNLKFRCRLLRLRLTIWRRPSHSEQEMDVIQWFQKHVRERYSWYQSTKE